MTSNVISESRKENRCDTNVVRLYETVESDELFLSVSVMGEIRKGVEKMRERNPRQALHLEIWREQLAKRTNFEIEC